MPATRRAFLGAAWLPALSAATGKAILPDRPRFFVAALTMVDRRGRFDDAANKDYLTYLREGGAEGVLVLGTTGEFSSFSCRERRQILESFLRHKGALPAMCQIGAPNLPDVLELLQHATSSGAESVLALPPFYFKNPSVDGLAAFYRPVLEAARIPVLLYNIPQLSGVAIAPELLRRLSDQPGLAGIKDSFSKEEVLLALIHDFPKLKIMTGVTRNIAAGLRAGSAGAITGNGSVFLRETAAIFEAFRKGGDVLGAQERFNCAAAALSGYDGIPAMKFALSRLGLRESYCRPPFTELSTDQKVKLAAALDRVRS
ncbi:MAG: dihydrodipicolinate synthase family protein [Bryobacteraceae bacterium]